MSENDDPFLARVIRAYAGLLDGTLYTPEFWPRTVREAERIASLLDVRLPCKVLDLACGTGAVTLALALQGFAVTGLDCNPEALDLARRMAEEKGVDVDWRCRDMRALDYQSEFDVVLLRDVIFGIFEHEHEDRDLLARMAAALMPGGKVLLEVYNKEFALKYGVEGRFFYDAQTNRFVDRSNKNPEGLSLRLYSSVEWEQMLASAGLELVKTDGWNWKNDPPSPPWRADFLVAGKRSEAS